MTAPSGLEVTTVAAPTPISMVATTAPDVATRSTPWPGPATGRGRVHLALHWAVKHRPRLQRLGAWSDGAVSEADRSSLVIVCCGISMS